MKHLMGAMWFLLVTSPVAWCESQETPTTIIDRAVKAVDGEGKMAAAKALTWETGGKTLFPNTVQHVEIYMEDINHFSLGEYIKNTDGKNDVIYSDCVYVCGDKGWNMREFERSYSPMPIQESRRRVYLEMIPVNPAILKDKAFKIESADRVDVAGKPADALKITGPEGLSFTLSFDVASGLPVRMQKSYPGENGKEITVVSIFAYYPRNEEGCTILKEVRWKSGDKPEIIWTPQVPTLEKTLPPKGFVPDYVTNDQVPPSQPGLPRLPGVRKVGGIRQEGNDDKKERK
jgi:hypothetical protein